MKNERLYIRALTRAPMLKTYYALKGGKKGIHRNAALFTLIMFNQSDNLF